VQTGKTARRQAASGTRIGSGGQVGGGAQEVGGGSFENVSTARDLRGGAVTKSHQISGEGMPDYGTGIRKTRRRRSMKHP